MENKNIKLFLYFLVGFVIMKEIMKKNNIEYATNLNSSKSNYVENEENDKQKRTNLNLSKSNRGSLNSSRSNLY